eukprot:m.260089 g.260089  ORF g.260089 m.260089 type:complete len:538 (+) comp19674_c0_seq5:191-1804(+)
MPFCNTYTQGVLWAGVFHLVVGENPENVQVHNPHSENQSFQTTLPPILPPPPLPPRTTAAQDLAIEHGMSTAKYHSSIAEAAVKEFLASSEVQEELTRCCSDFLPQPMRTNAGALLQRLRDEMKVVELVHNFNAKVDVQVNGTSHSPGDVNLTIAAQADYLYNVWELQVMGYMHNSGGDTSPEDSAETGMFGLPEFTGANNTPATWKEATDRVTYMAVNSRRIDMGNAIFGDISVVFSRRAVRNMTLMAPADTGLWEMSCNSSWPRLPRVEGRALNCSGWSGALAIASLEDFDHLFLPALRFWNGTLVGANQTARHTGPVVELANFVQRMMAPWDHVLSVERTEVLKYWEANILGAAKFPDTVQFIIGHFPTLFGSALGDALREWCERRGWVLVWALGVPRPVHGSMDDHWTTPLPYNRRVLDAVVLRRVAVVNATEIASESAVDAFSQQWEEVSRTRAAGSAPQVNWTHAFAKLPPVLAVEPITAGDCAEVGGPDQCVGVRTLPGGDGHRASTEQRLGRTPSRQCVCYGDSPNVDE